MSIGLLDLHDTNLQLWHQDTRVQSPGYALLKGKEYLFGAPARAAAKLQPRAINTRYWWQLSTELLQPALGPARHTGDLVHAHLRTRRRNNRMRFCWQCPAPWRTNSWHCYWVSCSSVRSTP